MVTKGLDFENVTLVGVLDADQSLYAQDYRARERTFSLITQVVGRAGRRFDTGKAVIQTYSPTHPVILTAARQDYEAFYEREMETRQALQCPPVCDLTVLTAVGEVEQQVLASLLSLKTRLQSLMEGQYADVKAPVLGPAAAQVVKVMGRYRYHLTMRAQNTARWRALVAGRHAGVFAGQQKPRGDGVCGRKSRPIRRGGCEYGSDNLRSGGRRQRTRPRCWQSTSRTSRIRSSHLNTRCPRQQNLPRASRIRSRTFPILCASGTANRSAMLTRITYP